MLAILCLVRKARLKSCRSRCYAQLLLLAAFGAVAACSDAPTGVSAPGAEPLRKNAAPKLSNWACSSSEWADGTTITHCEWYEPGSSYSGPYDYDPNEPATQHQDCYYTGTCDVADDPCVEDPSSTSCQSTPATSPSEPPPEGVSQEGWNSMNAKEKEICKQNLAQCYVFVAHAMESIDKAHELAQQNNQDAVDNIYDAIRHAYWQALMTRDLGKLTAKKWGDAHEWNDPDRESVCMDQFNNEAGRQIGYDANPFTPNSDIWDIVVASRHSLASEPFSC